MPKLRLYDSTRLDAAKKCMRYYFLRHEKHFKAEGTKPALVFGSCWGSALDVVWRRHKDLYEEKELRADVIEEAYTAWVTKWTADGFKHPDTMTIDDIDDLKARTPTNALEMIGNYIDAREHLFTDPSFELLTIEEPFIVPLDPNDPTLFYVGRMDKVFRYRNQVLGLDHKTTSDYNGSVKSKSVTFSGTWIDSWGKNSQLDGYSFVGHQQYGAAFGGIWIDGALVHKTVHDAFKLIPIDKQLPQLNKWLWNTITWIEQIEANKAVLEKRSAENTPYLAAYPENEKSCISYQSKCNYFEICRMCSNPAKLKDPLGFTISPWSPFDELKLEKLGLSQENVEP